MTDSLPDFLCYQFKLFNSLKTYTEFHRGYTEGY